MSEPDRKLGRLLANNRRWSERLRSEDPNYFSSLVAQQSPRYLWIGCSDSRVPANTIIGLQPGEVFVHRNVGNVVVHTDLNCLSVIQYAVEVLKVEHIIVCGHYGCGGVRAAMRNNELGLIDNWLRHVKDVYEETREQIEKAADFDARVDALCEANVHAQVAHVCQTTIVQGAWRRGQDLVVHGWIYDIHDGLIRDLGHRVSEQNGITPIFRTEPP